MINIKNLCKNFDNRNILDNVSFEIHKGDFIAVMGPSGSGKSTLLYSISGMDKIDSGEIIYQDKPIHELSQNDLANFRLNHMGFVFQSPQMLKNLNVLDNIMLPAVISNKLSYEEIELKAISLMKSTEIDHVMKNDIKKVSGGQLQRAAICRSLINEPSILFMDEPTGALNSEATDQILSIIEKLNKEGSTIFMVTHDKYVASKAQKILYMKDGNIQSTLDVSKNKSIDLIDNWIKSLQ